MSTLWTARVPDRVRASVIGASGTPVCAVDETEDVERVVVVEGVVAHFFSMSIVDGVIGKLSVLR
jgi:hypothetical protein